MNARFYSKDAEKYLDVIAIDFEKQCFSVHYDHVTYWLNGLDNVEIIMDESEKPAEDAENTAYKIYMLDKCESDKPAIKILIEFAESYHAKKCAKCKKVEPRKYYPLGQEPIEWPKCTEMNGECHARNGELCMNGVQCRSKGKE